MSASSNTNKVDLYDRDDSSGRQQWELTQIPGEDTYNVRLPTGMGASNTYLSCRGDGFVDMWQRDDDSGRQKWKLVNKNDLRSWNKVRHTAKGDKWGPFTD